MNRGIILALFYCKYVETLAKMSWRTPAKKDPITLYIGENIARAVERIQDKRKVYKGCKALSKGGRI
jgi:hypothetical protein